jgi:hypothetical protein
MTLTKIKYDTLNAKQKENFNYQKVSAVLADYGYMTMRLSDDWQGADFIAQHIDGQKFLRVQLKGRLSLDKKYLGKGLHMCFPDSGSWYLHPYDEVANHLLQKSNISNTESWQVKGIYNFPYLSQPLRFYLEKFRL